MKKILVILAIAVLGIGGGTAHAVIPTVDGLVTSADEWDDYIIFGSDINDAGISDSWDIKQVFMKVISLGGATDGLYFRMDTWGAPTFTGGPGNTGETFFQFGLDYDGDGVFERLVDLNDILNPGSRIVGVYKFPYGAGDKLADNLSAPGTTKGLSSIVEMYVPDDWLSTTIGPNFGLFAVLDNKGTEPDDRLPAEGVLHPVPEPTSMALLGMGLIGLVGSAVRRRKFMA